MRDSVSVPFLVAVRGCPVVGLATKVVRAAAACLLRLIKTSTTTEATTPVEDPLTTNMGEAIIAQVAEATQTSTAATIGAAGDPRGATTRRNHG